MTRITYLRDDYGKPIVCLAFNHQPGDTAFKYQMTVCHPKDRCEKKVAVAKATERLNDNPIEVKMPTDLDSLDLNRLTLCKIAMARDIFNNPSSPKRAAKLAVLWDPY